MDIVGMRGTGHGVLLGMIEIVGSGWLWMAAGAVVAPVVVHWLSRSRGRQMVLPTAAFFEDTAAGRGSVKSPRDLLALLVRALILALLVLAWARPVWRSDVVHAGEGRGRVVVYLLDVSASMRESRGAVSIFDVARRELIKDLESLRERRDAAAVVLMGNGASALLPEVTSNIGELIKLVQDVEPTYERDRIDAALVMAVECLRHASGGRAIGELVVYSDGRVAEAERLDQLGHDEPGLGIRSRIVGGTAGQATNVRLFNASVIGQPVVHHKVVLSTQVGRWGGAPGEVLVKLSFQGQQQEKWVDLATDETQAVDFDVVPQQVGIAWGRFSVEPVAGGVFRFDNESGVAMRTGDRWPVVLVTDSDVHEPLSASYYVYRALDAERKMDVQVVQTTNRNDLTDVTAIVVVEAGAMGTQEISALQSYVSRGGVLIWVVDSDAALSAFSTFSRSEARGGMVRVPEHLGWSLDGIEDPLLKAFDGAATAALLSPSFERVIGLPQVNGARRLLWFTNGDNALIYWPLGRGEVAAIGADIAPDNSDLVTSPAFVALLHELIRGMLVTTETEEAAMIGDSPMVNVAMEIQDMDIRLVGPSRDTLPLGQVVDGQIAVGPVPTPGPYRVVNRHGEDVGGVWVGVDPQESRTQRAVVVRAAYPNTKVSVVSSTSGKSDTSKALWPYLVISTLILIAFERLIVG